MFNGRPVIGQLLDFVPKRKFRRIVASLNGEHRMRSFSCWDQFVCMAFAQVTFRESLRDIEKCLRSNRDKLYHIGIRGRVARSTLAEANDTRDWRIYEALAKVLIQSARSLYASTPLDIDFAGIAYAFDSTTIDLCLKLFPWAKFRRRKAAVKLHTLVDLRGVIPAFVIITAGNVHDVKALDQLPLEAGAMYVMDRGYVDFARLYRITTANAFFVVRGKINMRFRRIDSRPVDADNGVRLDQTIRLSGANSGKDYQALLRRIKFTDPLTGKRFVFLTNNFVLSAVDIARLYKARWQVELFFKWIKQHLRIKAFYGTSENAVRTQVWIAMSVYTLVVIIKKELKLPQSLYTILQILSVVPFEKTPILSLFSKHPRITQNATPSNQLKLL